MVGETKKFQVKNAKNTTLALHWLVHGQFRNKGLKQCVQNWTNWKKETCVDPPIYQGQLSKANQKSNFNAEACNILSLHSVRSEMFYHLGQGLCVCVRVCVRVCAWEWACIAKFQVKKEDKYSKCQMPVCGYVCMCVCGCVGVCVGVCVCVCVGVWCVEGSWTDRSDKTMAGCEPGKGVQLGVWVCHLGHFSYPHGRGDKKITSQKREKTQCWPCTGLFMGNLEIKVWNSSSKIGPNGRGRHAWRI